MAPDEGDSPTPAAENVTPAEGSEPAAEAEPDQPEAIRPAADSEPDQPDDAEPSAEADPPDEATPVAEAEPEPVDGAEPDPADGVEPVAEAVPAPVDGAEPVAEAEPEPVDGAEAVAEAEPEPVDAAEAVAEAVPELVEGAEAGPGPVDGAKPVAETAADPDPTGETAVVFAAVEPVWAIDAVDLVKTYRGRRRADPRVQAVRGITLRVRAGTIFGLLGPNGAGKSTTVRMLATLTRPDAGSATVAGHDLLRHPWEVRRSIGIVPQRSGADPDATGRENLLLQGRLYGLGGAELARRADELLDRFGLADAAGRLARTYSGGMLRRLDVAIGLVSRPAVLFLDEPTTGLDPEARAVMWAEIEALTADGLSILLTTHYLEEADRLASQVAIIENGQVVVEGTPDELKSELHGDAVELELTATPDARQVEALRIRLATLPGVGEVTFTGRAVRARVDGGAAILPALFAAVDGAGLATAAATVARPSLDDVYLRHVGHRFGRQEEVA
ncbi:ATP-binding cassette domain-containing protein [Frankia sp. AgB1.9]|nr:ATP-binding cassette domain-containing protein [Frankia sp. AgW1.1]MBL7550131.1 ATP-binding cassette domain-containing protein [Frankia sp. AgB1.9]MBL7618354.1 ATP-binding cassette domain-containing protein [Frankia sp. AgB1.8]